MLMEIFTEVLTEIFNQLIWYNDISRGWYSISYIPDNWQIDFVSVSSEIPIFSVQACDVMCVEICSMRQDSLIPLFCVVQGVFGRMYSDH